MGGGFSDMLRAGQATGDLIGSDDGSHDFHDYVMAASTDLSRASNIALTLAAPGSGGIKGSSAGKATPPKTGGGVQVRPGMCFAAGTPIALAHGSQPIEDVQVGQRVLTDDDSQAVPQLRAEEFRTIELLLRSESNGDVLDVTLLRTVEWMQGLGCEAQCSPGHQAWMELPEQGVEGWATVQTVTASPALAEGPGHLVTGTFRSWSETLHSLRLDDGSELQATASHPLWSVDDGGWVATTDLRVGERLATRTGAVRVASIEPIPGLHRVFNLEVASRHCYFAGEHEILAHNSSSITPRGGGDIPARIYRGATRGNRHQVSLRPGEAAVSFREHLSNPLPPPGQAPQPVLRPGKNFIEVDTSRLPPGSVRVDEGGHVSVTATAGEIVEATVGGGKFPK